VAVSPDDGFRVFSENRIVTGTPSKLVARLISIALRGNSNKEPTKARAVFARAMPDL
jgi:hypothetical protein